jgi:flagella basal body P-ring formation protein FlgA
LQGEMYTVPVVVLGGQMTVVQIVTAPLKAMEPGAAGETNVRAP